MWMLLLLGNVAITVTLNLRVTMYLCRTALGGLGRLERGVRRQSNQGRGTDWRTRTSHRS